MLAPNTERLRHCAFRPAERGYIPRLRRELGLPAELSLIGLIARYDPMKDHGTFLRAAGLLSKTRPDAHFVLVGQAVDRQNAALTTIVAQESIQDRVHLLGERNDVPRIMQALDVVTPSSYGEGFPNVIGEAMACGAVCVVTDAGDSRRIVGETGIVVPPRDP